MGLWGGGCAGFASSERPAGRGFGPVEESGAGVGGSGREGEPGPVAVVFEGGFLEAPVAVEAVVGPAPEGFGGLAMCAGGYVCGSAQVLPGPTGLSCSVTASVIVFSWNRVSGADNYTAKLQLAVAGSRQTVRTTSGTTAVFGGLSSSTRYYIGVHSNVGGVAQYYSGVYCTTAVGPPSCGVVSASGVQLMWRADSRVHQWYAGRATTGSQYADGRLLAASTLSTVFTGLEANVSYTFFFWWRASPTSAWNQVQPSTVCTTMAPPAAPVVSCTTTASSISASWGSVRGAVRYRVSRGSGWATASGRSHAFSNLAASTAYTVRVQGWNSAGWGQTGTARCTTLAAALPAPTGLKCEATSSQVRFSWNVVMEYEQGNKITKQMEILDACYDRYTIDSNNIYAGDKLNIRIVKEIDNTTLDQVDGGIHERLCRWTSDKVPMPCFLYDTGNPQGKVIDDAPNGGAGDNPFTPYPSAFISLTDPVTRTKFAVWPSKWPFSSVTTPWPSEVVTSSFAIYRAVKSGEFVRCSPGYNPVENKGDNKGTCHGETYAPFGLKKVVRPEGEDRSIEGWFNASVPYREGGTEADKHELQVQTCSRLSIAQVAHTFCWWENI